VVILPDSGERYLSTELFADKEQSTLRLYNTVTREKEFFKPIHSEEILMHSCGPTVHEVPHVGNYRRFVVSDMIRRYLEFKGYKVKHVMNIIDLDDRSIKEAEQANVELGAYTEQCTREFLHDIEKLNIKQEEMYPRASENVEDMVKLVEKLVEKGCAYEKLRSVYFDISKIDEYGRLSHIDLKKVKAGKTIDLDDYEKDSPMDFTLLKRSTLNELKRGIYYKTRWGNVRPSWHLECAAISLKYLSDTFDIHASGTDVVFPHCENVMAIGRGATGKRMANYWINTELVMVDDKKMSRSLNNVRTIEELESMGYGGREIRFFLLGTHYRKPLNFSFGALDTAKNTVKKLNRFIQQLVRFTPGTGYSETDQCIYDVKQKISGALDDDFNISGALASLFEFVRQISVPLSQGLLNEKERDDVLDIIKKIDSVLGVIHFKEEILSEEVLRLLEERKRLRKAGNWKASDEIRKTLVDMGIEVSDTVSGMMWRMK
jgi:cysteinyl-tRNA synthetase